MRRAASTLPFFISQRGLSGTNNMPRKKTSAGPAVNPNIQRHPCCPNHEVRMNSSLAPCGRLCESRQLMICASNAPVVMVSWLIETNLPRNRAGAISAMYMGERFDASPMATPPKIRQPTKTKRVGASPLPMEVTPKSKAEKINSFLRPQRSLRAPAASAPARQPTNAQLLAHPTSTGSWI